MATKKPCRHSFYWLSSTGQGAGGRKLKLSNGEVIKRPPLTLGFRCKHCGEKVERKATPGERKFHDSYVDKIAWPEHKVWHEFARKFKKNNAYLWIGANLMDRVERWATKYPNDVRIVNVDDSYFSSSILVLVEHRATMKYMGTSVVVIPQCSGESPIEFFLYPQHRRNLVKALGEITAAATPIEKRERLAAVEKSRAIRKNLRHPAVI
jgi:hypothetical protein